MNRLPSSRLVPLGSFFLAVVLAVLAGPGPQKLLLRAAEEQTGDKKKVCLKIIVLGAVMTGSKKGTGSSDFLGKDEQVKMRAQVASEIWCQAGITFEPIKVVTVRGIPDAVGDDGNLKPFPISLSHFYATYWDEIDPKCLNLLLVPNLGPGTVLSDDPTVDRINSGSNLSVIPDGAMGDVESAGHTMAHEIGHQMSLADKFAASEANDHIMWQNATTRIPRSKGGAKISPQECEQAREKICGILEPDSPGYDRAAAARWLLETLEPLEEKEKNERPPGKDAKKARKALEKRLKKAGKE